MASADELPSGSWRLSVYMGRDPLTRRKRYEKRTVSGAELRRLYPDLTERKAAQREANRWEIELHDGDLTGERGKFRQLCDELVKHSERSLSPSSLGERRRIIRTYLMRSLGDIDVEQITARTLDVFYAELTARGGRCQHRPCPRTPCPEGRARCQRYKRCPHPPCVAHAGGCADWEPCEAAPCPHGGPLSVATVHRIHNEVHAALALAVRWGWVRRNVADLANPGEVLEEEIEPPAEEDVIPVLAEAERHDPRLADYLAVAIETGARRGPMHALRWTYLDLGPDVDEDDDEDAAAHREPYTGSVRFPRVISIGKGAGRGQRRPEVTLVERPAARNKRTSRRPIGISTHTTARLRVHRARMRARTQVLGVELPADAYVFSDDPLGAVPWHPDSTSRKFRLLRGGVGLDETRLHDWRHFMASHLLAAKIDAKVVAQRGGWTQAVTMMDRYAHALPVADREAAEIMGRVVSGSTGPDERAGSVAAPSQ